MEFGSCTGEENVVPQRILDQHTVQYFQLIEKHPVSHNTAIYRFALPSKTAVLGLPIGQHISLVVDVDGRSVSRSYTPTSQFNTQGHFDLMIKSYPTGAVSSFVAKLEVGDTVGVKGPRGAFTYTPRMVKELGMIAGGTGITPMLQIIRAILSNPHDPTKVSLIFANVTDDDILLREELDELAKRHDNLKVHYVLNDPPEGWTGGVGFVTREMIEKWLPPPAKDIKILLCGPPAMIKAMTLLTNEIGYEPTRPVSKLTDQIYCF
ncbi:hypothetical protein BC943DRAFT_223415 [Umbelopsis sp. AD052]|nr:hypothetical protein BC943DRAFT_223415 [Umbelopsis sp. AD052]